MIRYYIPARSLPQGCYARLRCSRRHDAHACAPGVGSLDARSGDGERRAGLPEPRLDRLERGGIGGFEREPGQSRPLLVAPACAGAVPDIAGDVVMVAAR